VGFYFVGMAFIFWLIGVACFCGLPSMAFFDAWRYEVLFQTTKK